MDKFWGENEIYLRGFETWEMSYVEGGGGVLSMNNSLSF